MGVCQADLNKWRGLLSAFEVCMGAGMAIHARRHFQGHSAFGLKIKVLAIKNCHRVSFTWELPAAIVAELYNIQP